MENMNLEELKASLAAKEKALEAIENKLAIDEEIAEHRTAQWGIIDEEKIEVSGKADLAKSTVRLKHSMLEEAFRFLKTYTKETKERYEQEYAPTIDPIKSDFDGKDTCATNAESLAKRWLNFIADKDASATARVDRDVQKAMQRAVLEKVRNEGIEETTESGSAARKFMARKYLPFDRHMDIEKHVEETPEANAKFLQAKDEHAALIDATLEKLKKLYSPERNKIKFNSLEGRLDPRKAYKIGMAMRGVPVDLSRVWRQTRSDRDPKVAVSLLIDCSGTMSGTRFELAAAAATCLSEVMRKLHIPHEIIGHTTNEEGMKDIRIDSDELEMFSRFLPFMGLVFKSFAENSQNAGSVYADFPMADNLDGEGVLWALKRLAARREHTKICIVLTDGIPHAAMSRDDELEQHLYHVCQMANKQEKNGLFLRGLGVGEERVREFYGPETPIINDIKDLPNAVMQIIEGVLVKQVGTLG